MKFGRAKTILLLTALSLSGCKWPNDLAEPPDGNQCQLNGSPLAFYCVHSKTKAREKRSVSDTRMKAAQCFEADYARELAAYEDYLISEAMKRCK